MHMCVYVYRERLERTNFRLENIKILYVKSWININNFKLNKYL